MSPGQLVAQADSPIHLVDPGGFALTLAEASRECACPDRQLPFVAHAINHQPRRRIQLGRQGAQVSCHANVIAGICEAVRDQARAQIGRAHGWPDMPGSRHRVRL
jgi:hypothetical protein